MYTVRTMSTTSPETAPAPRRAAIVAAAVRIADAEGVEAVSMRRLAEELGVATMTPYTHVAGKDELLDLMRDVVAAEILIPEPLPEDWREALGSIAHRTKDAFEAHPWVLDARPRYPRARINHLRHIEQSVGVVIRLGADRGLGRAVLMSVDDYVVGYCLRARSREQMVASLEAEKPHELRSQRRVDPEVMAAIEAGELPMVAKIMGLGDHDQPFGIPPDSGFEPGLKWLLDGIEVEIEF
jgi:AcrR family transcriptional regulator